LTAQRLAEIEAKVRELGLSRNGMLGKEFHELLDAVRRSLPIETREIVAVDKTFVPILSRIMSAFDANQGFAVETYTTDGEHQTAVTFYILGER